MKINEYLKSIPEFDNGEGKTLTDIWSNEACKGTR